MCLVIKLFLDHETHSQHIPLINAVSLYKTVHLRPQSDGLNQCRNEHLEELIRVTLVVSVLFLKIPFNRFQIDSFTDKSLIISSVGVDVRHNGVQCIKISQPDTIPSVSAFSFYLIHSFPLINFDFCCISCLCKYLCIIPHFSTDFQRRTLLTTFSHLDYYLNVGLRVGMTSLF